MREVKFRGKSVKNCEWLYGYLFPRSLLEDADYLEPLWIASGLENECMAVDKETVGQFIGLYDKNGKEIYEGDIVKFEDVSGYKDGCASVIWHEDSCGYYLENDDDNIYDTLYDFTPSYQMEIIGNIHENPELLEERE